MNQRDIYKLNFSDEIQLNELEEFYQEIELDEAPEIITGVIRGRVEDNLGNDIENATVKIFDTDFNPIKHTMTNAEGNFTLQNIPVGEYNVYVVKDGYIMSNKRPLTFTGEDINLQDFVINPDPTYSKGNVYGYVYDDKGHSFDGAIVRLLNAADTVIAETISATDGEYVFSKLDAGNYKITAVADDYDVYTPYLVEVLDNTNSDLDIYLNKVTQAKEGTINGVVYNRLRRTPIVNAIVGLYEVIGEGEETSLKLRKTCTTNIEGKYFFGVVPEGRWVVKSKATSGL